MEPKVTANGPSASSISAELEDLAVVAAEVPEALCPEVVAVAALDTGVPIYESHCQTLGVMEIIAIGSGYTLVAKSEADTGSSSRSQCPLPRPSWAGRTPF
jgi:hypothetical protein